jgi:hypothetical protein
MRISPTAARKNQGLRLPQSTFASHHFRAQILASIWLLLFVCGLNAQQLATPASQIATPESRAQHFTAQRSTVDGSSSALAFQRARVQAAAMLFHPRGATLTAAWQPLGPVSILSPTYGNLTGRITSLALDPNDPTGNTLYAGTTGGGVWKSTNAASTAVSFIPLTDTLPVFAAGTGTTPSLSIGALAVQPIANPVLLDGTGDPNDATDSYYGEGLLRSTDGGLTWNLIPESHDGANGNHSFAGLATAAIAFSSATPTLVVAAFTTSPESTMVGATNSFSIPGLYYSTNSGQTWQMSTIMDGSQIVQQPQPLGTGQAGNAATAVVWDSLRQKFFAAVRAHGYYSSPDGISWTRLAAQPGTNLTTTKCPVGSNGLGNPSTCPIFRGALAAQPVTGDLYALTVDANSLDQGLWQDLCNATSGGCSTPAPIFANRIDNAALEAGGSGAITQGTYNLTLAVEPAAANSTLLFAGTMDLYRCAISANSSACAFRNTTNSLNGCTAPNTVAPAQHAIATLTAAAPLIFIGNDGGLWRSLDGVAVTGSVCSATDASHFNNLNAALGSLAEITGFAQHPTDPNTLLAGLGANGSAATSNAYALTAWPQLSAGEGGFPSLDPARPTNWYLAIGAGVDLKQCPLGSACTVANFASPATIGEAQVSYDATVLDAPTLLDPALTTNLLVATCRVWRGPASSNSTWSTANAISPALNGSATPCTSTSPVIRSLAAGGPSTTSANSQNSGSEVIYAGLAGTLDGGSTIPGHLFVTKSANLANAATPWTDIAKSPVSNDTNAFNYGGFDISSIAVDPHDATGATVYAAIMGFGVPHLYRSTDFGAHWANLSNNLPDAPANAVLVDPNDANTVYIALDTGVYVTTAVLTCSTATANCWSPLGTGLPNAPVVALSAAANIPTGDGRLGMLRAATYGRGLWQQPLLTATNLAQPALTLSATNFTFAAQQVSTQSAAQTLTVTSSGNAPVTFGALVISGDFTETDNCAQQTLAVNSSCTVQISFAPTATGARAGQLTLYANIAGGQALVSLSGTGTAPATITFTPAAITFAATLVNQTAAPQNIVVANLGGTTATLQTPTIIGINASDFAISANTCSSTLGASTACTLSITFTPTTSGTRTAQLSLTDSAGTQTAQLTGTGNAPATDTLTPATLTFAQQTIGTTSAAQQVTLTNSGDVALTLISASVTPGDFTTTNACGTSLAAHSTCAIQVNFVPTATGARSATLTVTDEFRSQLVPLAGTGIAPPGVSLSPTALNFAATGVSLTSTPQTLTLTNNGGQPLNIASITSSPGFTIASNTCVSTLAPNTTCALQIVFAPTAVGAITGAITLIDNAPTPTQTAALSGTGIDFMLAPTGPTTATVSSATTTSAMYTLQLNSLSTLSGTVALSCAGAPANATCNVTPSTAPLGTTVPINVTVLINTKAQLAPPFPFRDRMRDATIVLALVFPVAFFSRRRLRGSLLSLASLCLVLFMTASLTACGAGRLIPNDGPTSPTYPTPDGTYNLTVSAASAGLTRTVGLTLIVQ